MECRLRLVASTRIVQGREARLSSELTVNYCEGDIDQHFWEIGGPLCAVLVLIIGVANHSEEVDSD